MTNLSISPAIWGMESDALQALAHRALAIEPSAFLSVPASRPAPTPSGPVAVIPVVGPIFPTAGFETFLYDGTGLDQLRDQLRSALANPDVRSIVMEFDTPGGQVTGVSALADEIRQATAIKPIVAFVTGSACSAGYWLASACTEIMADDTARLGSIGVRYTLVDSEEMQKRLGVRMIHVLSSGAPNKGPDYSDAGIARIRAQADAIEGVFIGKVAEYRGLTPARVRADFGRGDVLVGQAAVRAGLADRVGSIAAVVREALSSSPSSGSRPAALSRPIPSASQESDPMRAPTMPIIPTSAAAASHAGPPLLVFPSSRPQAPRYAGSLDGLGGSGDSRELDLCLLMAEDDLGRAINSRTDMGRRANELFDQGYRTASDQADHSGVGHDHDPGAFDGDDYAGHRSHAGDPAASGEPTEDEILALMAESDWGYAHNQKSEAGRRANELHDRKLSYGY